MSEKQNIRDHKRRLLAAKYELRRKLYKFVKIPIDLVICGTNIVISCPSCQEIVPLHE
uniref:Ribosomal protein S14 n=2 Tax=Astereae TaxID=102809 RepID=A0A1U9GZW8_9ASTR|nr:ribosomal protein S14 [Diplostephium hartwegii]YP_010943855.1 ribosomal protein S14 [Aster batangensis]AOW70630.1 ribosomal protein S14 [Diplostephium hartwegii]WLW15493.1 ribosomal protein S14 [Aster batangensis]